MQGFRTRNSNYYVDSVNNVIWGGKLGNKKYRFTVGRIEVGQPGYIRMTDGNVLITGTVREVF